MAFLADLHVHSHFSRATSQDCRPVTLAAAAARKGLTVVGTGDFTHAGWRAELREELVEAEEGLYALRGESGPHGQVRFVVTGEISCIYKQGGRTRKIHHLVLMPNLAAAEAASAALEKRGANLASDGRPIIGMDSRTLLDLLLKAAPQAVLIPAHIWTPHFSLFGAVSGFDALEECFGDLSAEIVAYETGLSSDPPMNWRLSCLDRLTLVSNSDAHSPDKLGREAIECETDLSFGGLAGALRREGARRVLGTVEFFPEEGKYHYDGHRNCSIRWHPAETQAAGGLCRVCGRPVTIGVLHRVHDLADRVEGFRPPDAPSFVTLVPSGRGGGGGPGVGYGQSPRTGNLPGGWLTTWVRRYLSSGGPIWARSNRSGRRAGGGVGPAGPGGEDGVRPRLRRGIWRSSPSCGRTSAAAWQARHPSSPCPRLDLAPLRRRTGQGRPRPRGETRRRPYAWPRRDRSGRRNDPLAGLERRAEGGRPG